LATVNSELAEFVGTGYLYAIMALYAQFAGVAGKASADIGPRNHHQGLGDRRADQRTFF
jgi:hypothetical protein